MAIELIRKLKNLLVGKAIAPLKHSLFDALCDDLDGVRVLPIDKQWHAPISPSLNFSYLFPSLLYLLYLFDLLYLYFIKQSNEATVDAVPMGNKVFPKIMAKEGGFVWTEASVMLLAISSQLLFHNMESFETKFRMLANIHQDGSLKQMKQNGKGKCPQNGCFRLRCSCTHAQN